jgi:NifU-like protein involved in Fe-S cluster formation
MPVLRYGPSLSSPTTRDEWCGLAHPVKRPYMPPVTSALYNRDILRLAASIPHQRRLDAPHMTVEKSSPVCGSRVVVDVNLDEAGRVTELGQEVRACALGQASAALMGANAIGRMAAELAEARDALAAFLTGKTDDPGNWPGLSVFKDARSFTARHASILLAFDAAAEAALRARRAHAA